jgi:hypothetical protein
MEDRGRRAGKSFVMGENSNFTKKSGTVTGLLQKCSLPAANVSGKIVLVKICF